MRIRPPIWIFALAICLSVGVFLIINFQGGIVLPMLAKTNDPKELYTLAENQITAFRRNDFPTAYTLAASGIRQKFPLPQFKEMVCQTYPHLTHSGRLNFGETQFVANVRASAMIYVNSENQSVPMIYAFVKEDGKWKIEGVQMLRAAGQRFTGGEPRT